MSTPHCLYVLVREDKGKAIYAGVTTQPWVRIGQHRNDPASGAWGYMRRLKGRGVACTLRVLAVLPDKTSALEIEARLLAKLGCLGRPLRCVPNCTCAKHRRVRATASAPAPTPMPSLAPKRGRPRIGDNQDRQPWLALGMSRRTWYGRQAEARALKT